jgi:hypothetical protein
MKRKVKIREGGGWGLLGMVSPEHLAFYAEATIHLILCQTVWTSMDLLFEACEGQHVGQDRMR